MRVLNLLASPCCCPLAGTSINYCGTCKPSPPEFSSLDAASCMHRNNLSSRPEFSLEAACTAIAFLVHQNAADNWKLQATCTAIIDRCICRVVMCTTIATWSNFIHGTPLRQLRPHAACNSRRIRPSIDRDTMMVAPHILYALGVNGLVVIFTSPDSNPGVGGGITRFD